MIIPPEDTIRFFVGGEPQPFPKKETKKFGKRMIPTDRDYRIRTNPITRQKEKYDHGHKRRWMKLVADMGCEHYRKFDIETFPKNHPIALGCLFFVTKSKSCRLPFPSQNPDYDNLAYAVWNALKGVCFHDDNQIVWVAEPSGVLWAVPGFPAGVMITMYDFLKYPSVKAYLPNYPLNSSQETMRV